MIQALGDAAQSGQLAYDPIVPLARQATAEGVVPLKNDDVLPIRPADKAAMFGRCAVNYLAVGCGSGGKLSDAIAVGYDTSPSARHPALYKGKAVRTHDPL